MRVTWFCAAFLVLVACEDPQQPDLQAIGLSYFPLELGSYRTYQVNSITFSLFTPTDTAEFQLKEVVADTFLTQNEPTFILHRFSRQQPQDNWTLDSVWTARKNQNHAIVVENNVPYLKMVFPIQVNKVWDGNLFNALPEDEYEITEIGGSLETPAGDFSNLLTVFEHNDPDTLIFQDIRQSVYANDVGLIYKKSSILNFCNDDPDCLGTLENGIKFEQILIEYGKQ
ncbi:MAG: hypothetical protein DHS20C17_27720 [Cyclobacteriaceae bacterium]|nr:MAG: hypothetical protein DHS20C17_27720 [Cyclobacteriaceae bacterium]